MKQPKIKGAPGPPKLVKPASFLPREAKNMLIRQYQTNHQKGRAYNSPNATKYAQEKIINAASAGTEKGAQAARAAVGFTVKQRPIQEESPACGGAGGPRADASASTGANVLRKNVPATPAGPEGQDPAPMPTARQAGRELQARRYARATAEARGKGYAAASNREAGQSVPTPPAQTAQQAGRELQAGRYAEASGRAKGGGTAPSVRRAGRQTIRPNAIKSGGVAVKAALLAVKTTVKASNSSQERQEQTTRQARQAAIRTAKAAWQTARTAKGAATWIQQASKIAARLLSSAARGLVAIAGMSGAAIIAALIIISCIAVIISSPFGILFSGNDNGPEVKPLEQIVSETNRELSIFIEQIKLDYSYVDEVKVTFDGSESNTAINNWCDVAAVFAVKAALADGDNAADVVTLDAEREERLKAVFWDMTPLETYVEEQTRTVTDEEGNRSSEAYTYYILHIVVESLDYREGAALYGFNDSENEVLAELMEPENYLLLLALIGAGGMGPGLSPAEIAAILAQLDGLNLDRQSFVTAALSLVGRVNYFWGGKSTAIGWDSRWGTPTKVTAEGSRSTGSTRPFGLDCSGYVAWCYAQLGVSPDIIGWGVTGQWNTSTAIEWPDAQPGDLAIFAVPGTIKTNHIGIVVGFDADGKPLVAHCSSGKNNVTVSEAAVTGFRYVRRPIIFGE